MLYGPSGVQKYKLASTRNEIEVTTYFHNLPAASNLIIHLLRYSRDSGEVSTLLYFVFLTDNDFMGLPVSEDQHLLRSACDDQYRNVILQDLPTCYVDLSNIEHFAVALETLLKVCFESGPEDIIGL